jgi:uncharacterized protein
VAIPAPRPSAVLAGIDRAAFAAALGARLRRAGVRVDLSRLESLVTALDAARPVSRGSLYWAARVSLVRHQREVIAFDEVFAAVFADAVFALDPNARRHPVAGPAPSSPDDGWVSTPGAHRPAAEQDGGGLPWLTRPKVTSEAQDGNDGTALLADPLPSAVAALADTPFEDLDPGQLRLLTTWLEAALADWPSRRTRRTRPHARGRRIDLRATLARGRATGWEPVRLVKQRPVRARRRVILLCDVSRSMQPYTTVYLHLMRAAAVTAQAEVFAFATELTRLTPALSAPGRAGASADAAVIERAAAQVTDRAGGTRIGYSLRRFLLSRHGSAARGAILVIASDGWDADSPDALESVMIRLHRRAHRVIWLNPRAAAPGFAPLTGAMAAALPHCHELLPGNTLRAVRDVVSAITKLR